MIEEFEIEDETIVTEDVLLVEGLGLDSLDFVDVVVIIEQEFGITLKAPDFEGITTFGQFCDKVYSLTQA
jgi:acyl carrier protein